MCTFRTYNMLLEILPFALYTSPVSLFYTTNMFILMILYDFCLSPAQFCYIIVHIQKVESSVQIVDRCIPWKIYNGAQNLALHTLQF
jgi:hypothetical protein